MICPRSRPARIMQLNITDCILSSYRSYHVKQHVESSCWEESTECMFERAINHLQYIFGKMHTSLTSSCMNTLNTSNMLSEESIGGRGKLVFLVLLNKDADRTRLLSALEMMLYVGTEDERWKRKGSKCYWIKKLIELFFMLSPLNSMSWKWKMGDGLETINYIIIIHKETIQIRGKRMKRRRWCKSHAFLI